LTSAQPQANTSKAVSIATESTMGRSNWTLTAEALAKLLEHFSANREEAGRQYNLMVLKLTRYFEWRSRPAPEELAEETISRVARRIDEGENVTNLHGYFFSVARLVFMESVREDSTVPLDEIPELPADEVCVDEEEDERLSCLDRCLDQLPVESRSLILKYYHDEKRAKIDYRKQLANALGIPLNALRIRAHRIRIALEKCVSECLTHAA
jgi:DNA-directed RNA polymerase specialized sigma24 family protein